MKRLDTVLLFLVLINIAVTLVGDYHVSSRLDHIERNVVLKQDSLFSLGRDMERTKEKINNWYDNNPDATIDQIFWE